MPRILIIDDEPDLRLALTATLEDHGYEVVEGSDGSEALDLAVQYAPDPIFIDVNMPVIDGTAALEILRRGGATHVGHSYLHADRRKRRRISGICARPWRRRFFRKAMV
jgi:CheY-like chemotaxis protein